jgi:glycosyltransferase involved in cell wall biosynthesis
MKIGIIVPGFSSGEPDWRIPVLVDVVQELARHVELHVFALRYPHRRGSYRIHGAQVHALGGGDAAGLKRASLLAVALRSIAAEHRRGVIDVLHGLWIDEPGFMAALGARMLRRKAVISVMGGELVGLPEIGYGGRLSRASRLLSGVALRLADAVTAGSGSAADLARGALPLSQQAKVLNLPWGINPAAFDLGASSACLAGGFRILHVASLVPVKDQDTLLRAFARVHALEPGAHLHIAGDGPLCSALLNRATSLGIVDAVTFHGYVPRTDLAGFYRQAHILAVSSRHEAQMVVVAEAALCGLPTAGTDVGLVADLAPAGALVVPVGDDAALARAFMTYRNSETRGQVAASAREHICREHLAGHTVERLLAIYRALAEQSAP